MTTHINALDIMPGQKIRAEIRTNYVKAVEYIAEGEADHRGFDAAHFVLPGNTTWGPYPDPSYLGVGATMRTALRDPAHLLPWAPPLLWWRRCKANRPYDGRTPHHGRCELRRRHDGDHALERGAEVPRWSTEWTA